MNTTIIFINTIGWTGAALVLIAYGLISIQWINGNSFCYQALNVTGALLLVINSYYLGAYPSVGVNAAWVGIAAIALFRDWWKGPVDTYINVKKHFPKRNSLRKATLQRIKLPAIRHPNPNSNKNQPVSNGFGSPQLS